MPKVPNFDRGPKMLITSMPVRGFVATFGENFALVHNSSDFFAALDCKCDCWFIR